MFPIDRESATSPRDGTNESGKPITRRVDAREAAVWATLVEIGDPRALLGFLQDGDPLGLAGRTAARLREQALLLEVDQVHGRVVARVAFECAMLAKRPEPEDVAAWIDRCIDRSMEELDREDREEFRQGLLAYEQWDARYLFLNQVLGVPEASTRACCLAFNALGLAIRRAFFAVSINGLSLELAAHREGVSEAVLRDRIRSATRAFELDGNGHIEFPWEEES